MSFHNFEMVASKIITKQNLSIVFRTYTIEMHRGWSRNVHNRGKSGSNPCSIATICDVLLNNSSCFLSYGNYFAWVEH